MLDDPAATEFFQEDGDDIMDAVAQTTGAGGDDGAGAVRVASAADLDSGGAGWVVVLSALAITM